MFYSIGHTHRIIAPTIPNGYRLEWVHDVDVLLSRDAKVVLDIEITCFHHNNAISMPRVMWRFSTDPRDVAIFDK